MTKAEQFEALALRCEQATRPDRRLDAEIDCLVRFPDLRPAELDDHKEYQKGYRPSAGDIWCPTGFLMAVSYTASLDAALTLLPEGYIVNLGNDEPIWAQVWIDIDPSSRGDGVTMALALCAAALRARSRHA